MGEFDALRTDELARLEAFAERFDEVDPLVYQTFGAGAVEDAELEPARAAALQAIGSGSARREAVRAAIKRFVDRADWGIADRHEYPGILTGGRYGSPRPEDRAAVLRTLERAVVAVIVWDSLTDDERITLLGPWEQIASAAIEPG